MGCLGVVGIFVLVFVGSLVLWTWELFHNRDR